MRIHFPRRRAGQEGPIYEAVLRNIEKVGSKWEVKISVPALSTIQNLYLELSEEEIERFAEAC